MTPMGGGTGPLGQAPGTGKGRQSGHGGHRRGQGGGRGWRHGLGAIQQTSVPATRSSPPPAGEPSPIASNSVAAAHVDTEKEQLSRQLGVLENAVAALQQRIRLLEALAQKPPGADGPISA